MVRGVVVVILVIATMMMALLVAGASVEDLGEEVKTYDSIDTVGGTSVINTLYDVIFKWMPIIVIGGMTAGWAVAWYIRKGRFTGRAPRR